MESEQVVSRIVDEIRSEGVEFNLDDPFDDPSLCTTAFLDITWQDEHGNSALMLAAAENRVLQVKGILTMAINSGKLWQVIDMRNQEGLNCVDMAVRAGSELCAMLITKIAREYAKHKPRPKLENVPVSDVDLEDELDKKNVEQLDDNYLKTPPIHSKSLITVPSARSTTPPQAIRSSSLASKPLSYQQTTSIE
uniref:Uncharacterized protein n=1 Tax=Caenorhabditis japonica TaxID=281687 RepID=A0A8R1J1Q5_CAEJA